MLPASILPVDFNTILPNSAAGNPVDFVWPATASRVAFTVYFAADGYTGQTIVNLVR